MIALQIILVCINLVIVIGGFIYVRYRLDKRYVNREVLNEVRQEINQCIIELDNAVLQNVDLINSKTESLKKLIDVSEMKIVQAQDLLREVEKKHNSISQFAHTKEKESARGIEKQKEKNQDQELFPFYSPTKIYSDSTKKKKQDIADVTIVKEEKNTIEATIAQMNMEEKIQFLIKKGYSKEKIRETLKIDDGEFELILNIKNITL